MAPFPLIKLGYLAVKQISKPIANYIKRRAKSHPFFRTYICMPPAQFYHWLEVNFRLRLMGLGSAKNVEKLNDKEAIELGGEMLGEFLVFGFASLILYSEYSRSARKEAAKEEKSKQEFIKLNSRLQELGIITEIQEAQIRQLQRQIDIVGGQKSKQDNHHKENMEKAQSSYVHRLFGARRS